MVSRRNNGCVGDALGMRWGIRSRSFSNIVRCSEDFSLNESCETLLLEEVGRSNELPTFKENIEVCSSVLLICSSLSCEPAWPRLQRNLRLRKGCWICRLLRTHRLCLSQRIPHGECGRDFACRFQHSLDRSVLFRGHRYDNPWVYFHPWAQAHECGRSTLHRNGHFRLAGRLIRYRLWCQRLRR